jgi:hypothetical protein
MASLLLALAAAAWLLAGVFAIAIGLGGAGWLVARLPPLTIDVAAVGGAAVAIGIGLVAVAVLHAVVAFGASARRRWAVSAGLLLSATMAAGFTALALAAATTLVRGSPAPALLSIAAVAAVGAVAGYAWCAVRLVRMLAVIGPRRPP